MESNKVHSCYRVAFHPLSADPMTVVSRSVLSLGVQRHMTSHDFLSPFFHSPVTGIGCGTFLPWWPRPSIQTCSEYIRLTALSQYPGLGVPRYPHDASLALPAQISSLDLIAICIENRQQQQPLLPARTCPATLDSSNQRERDSLHQLNIPSLPYSPARETRLGAPPHLSPLYF